MRPISVGRIGRLVGAATTTAALVLAWPDAGSARLPFEHGAARPVAAHPWNVVLVLTDDQPASTLAGMSTVQAEIAARGVTFTNAVVSNPLCCPSRATILTGRYSHVTGVWTNFGSHGGIGSFAPWERRTVAARLHRAGYTTGFVGKYLNLYGRRNPHYVPPGWDRWVAFVDLLEKYYGYTLNVDGRLVAHGRAPADYSTDVLAREARRFVRTAREPFFLLVAPTAPHRPFTPAPRHRGKPAAFVPSRSYNEVDMRDKPRWARQLPPVDVARKARDQIRTLMAVDDLVRGVVRGLQRTRRIGRTAILYMSDNGFSWGSHRWVGKGVPWEESIRVPLVVRADGLAAPGTADHLVANTDIAPTILELAGVEPMETDGRSLLPLLRGEASVPARTSVTLEYMRFPRQAAPVSRIPSYCGLRLPDSVYVQYSPGGEELYDLRSDPWQLENLARKPAQRGRIAQLRSEAKELCDPLPPVPSGWELLGTDPPRPASAREGALPLATGPPAARRSPTAIVSSTAGFAAAVERFRFTGGTIVLRKGRYEQLVVGPRGWRRLTIRAQRGASAGYVGLIHTRAVTLSGLRITPRWTDANLQIHESRQITVEGLTVTASGSRLNAGIDLEHSHGVLIRDSSISRCGDGHLCLLTGHSSGVRIVGNHFHDCFGCDFVRGHFTQNVTIRGNRFDRALVGPCGTDPKRCNHQELVELQEGRGLVVEQNVFGVYQLPGAAQLALFGPLRGVRIRNNLFLATDPRAPGVVAHVAINLGGWKGVPRDVVISNNTILSGTKRSDRWWSTSIRFKTTYKSIRRGDRPVLANNVIRLAATPALLCDVVQLSATNVIERGTPCSDTDVVGDPGLDEDGRPTADSTLVIGQATTAWATRVDIAGVERDAEPDVGAYEYVPPAPPDGVRPGP